MLSIVPMFHANAWGTPYGGFMTGADLIMPQQFLQAAPLAAIIGRYRPTISAGVPTIWSDLLRYAQTTPVDLSSLRMITAGGAAVPRQLIERFRDELGVEMVQGWGMTETSPLCSLATPPRQAAPDDEMEWRAKTGRIVPGVELRICADDGTVLPNDGEAVGEFEVRGPWITGSYYGDPVTRTGSTTVGCAPGTSGRSTPMGYMQISDRSKDVIKSGGEWISSVELENEVMAHPEVVEAAVIAVPDERWCERPLVAVVLEQGSTTTPDDLLAFLTPRVSRWWLPERWSIITEVPEDQRGQVRQEGAPGPPCRRRPRGHRGRRSSAAEVPDLDDIAERLGSIAEDLADAALDRLRQNADSVRAGGEPDPALTAEEKRITRARRAVEKAAILLGGNAASTFDDGP